MFFEFQLPDVRWPLDISEMITLVLRHVIGRYRSADFCSAFFLHLAFPQRELGLTMELGLDLPSSYQRLPYFLTLSTLRS